MGHVLCEKHGLICSLKTGLSEGSSNYGKTFYLCPLYPNECSFMKLSSLPPQFCKHHTKNMIDLKIFKKLPNGEIMEYSRCKESKNTSKKFCNHQVIKIESKSASGSNKPPKEEPPVLSADKVGTEGVCNKKDDTKEVCSRQDTKEVCNTVQKSEGKTTSLPLSSTEESQRTLEPKHKENSTSRNFREPAVINSSSSDEESDRENKAHTEPIEKQLVKDESSLKKVSALTADIENERSHLKQALDKKKRLYQTIDVAKLPDKGARLKTEIEKLEAALNQLQLVRDNGQPPCSEDNDKDNSRTDSSMKPSVEGRISAVQKEISVQKKASPPFLHVPESFETFKDLRIKSDSTQDMAAEKSAILIPPLPLSSPSFVKYRSTARSNSSFLTSTDETKKKIQDATINLQKSLQTFPDETQQEDNPAALSTSLLPHQRCALTWLLWRESHPPHGGILADDMGLGKSLTMISLILKHKENTQNKVLSAETDDKKKFPLVGPTLVICPASLIHHWENEILHHCKKGSVKSYVHHGHDRIRDPERMHRYDVIITTYETLRADLEPDLKSTKVETADFSNNSKQHSYMKAVSWERIILDEAHNVKNPTALVSKSIYLLSSKYRWAITGTPIHNNLTDLYSLIKFLCYSPFDNAVFWKKYISGIGTKNLMNTLVKCLLLRRTKEQTDKEGKHLVQLPPKEIKVTKLKLTEKERDIYNRMHNFCLTKMNAFVEEKTSSGSRRSNETKRKPGASFFLVMLLRLQQCCCHLALLQKTIEEEASFHKDAEEKDLAEQLSSLSLNTSESGHSEMTVSNSAIKDNAINFESLGLSSFADDEDFNVDANSTKVLAILEQLKKIQSEATDGRMEKCVLVSQWVSFLEIMAEHIKAQGFHFSMITGNTKVSERMNIVDNFNNVGGKEILLLSLKAGGVGLNLIGGNHLFLLDNHWNPALENQACDRIYRIGQTKKVFIYKFVCLNTIEEKIVHLQKEKLCLARNVLEGGKSKEHFTLKDMQELLNL